MRLVTKRGEFNFYVHIPQKLFYSVFTFTFLVSKGNNVNRSLKDEDLTIYIVSLFYFILFLQEGKNGIKAKL